MAVKYPVLAARVTITTGENDVLRVSEDSGAATFDCTLAAGDYYLAEDDTQSGSLLKALKDALDAGSLASGGSYTYGLTWQAQITPGSVSGRLVITTTGTNVSLLGSHANTTFDLAQIGLFPGVTGYFPSGYVWQQLSPWANWVPGQPMTDDLHEPQRRPAAMHETRGGQTYVFAKGAVVKRRSDLFQFIVEERIRTNLPAGLYYSLEYSALERWWEKTVADGRPFRLYWVEESATDGVLDELTSGYLIGTYVLEREHIESPPAWQMVDAARLYDVTINSREYKA